MSTKQLNIFQFPVASMNIFKYVFVKYQCFFFYIWKNIFEICLKFKWSTVCLRYTLYEGRKTFDRERKHYKVSLRQRHFFSSPVSPLPPFLRSFFFLQEKCESAQPATVACKMEAQSEYVCTHCRHIFSTFGADLQCSVGACYQNFCIGAQ